MVLPRATRFRGGINDSRPETFGQLASLRTIDPSRRTGRFDDFLTFANAAWVQTDTGASTSAGVNPASGHGGVVRLNTGSAVASDQVIRSGLGREVEFSPGEDVWYDTLMRVNDASAAGIIMGITDDVAARNNEVVFSTQNGDGEILVDTTVGGVGSIVQTGTILEDNVYTRISYHITPQQEVVVYVNNRVIFRTFENVPVGVAMRPVFGVVNLGAANALIDIDYICIVIDGRAA